MAGYSNRSPSPLSTRPINPNPKISEVNSGPRRSFTGNSRPSVHTNPRNFYPSTPANSPSDFARRRSVGKEGIFASKDHDEKENDEKAHNLKAAKIREVGSGSKNFMSPTISAASKFTPSPRKKALVERNDPVRTSMSLSDGKALFFSADFEDTEPKFDMDSNLNKISESSLYPKVSDEVSDKAERKSVLEGPPASKPLKKVTFLEVPSDSKNTFDSMSDSVIIDSDYFNENKTSCSYESPVIAPLDADPSMPPYDPKTNYLSPRPQFLHYKPNPRIEILLNKRKGIDSDEFNKLEDSFMTEIMSGNSSDSDGTEESTQQEESEDTSSIEMVLELDEKEEDMVLGVDEKEEETRVSDSLPISATVPGVIPDGTEESTQSTQKEESEDTSSIEMVLGLDEKEEDMVLGVDEKEETRVSDSLPISATVPDVISEGNFEAKRDKRPSWVFPRLNWVSLLLIFLIACVSVSVTDLPVTCTSRLKDLSLTNLYYESSAAAFTKTNLDRFVRYVNPYSVNSISYISKLITVFGREDKLGTLQFMNLTDLQKEIMIDEHFMNKQFSKEFDENEMEEDVDTEFQEFEEEVSAEVDSDEIIDQEMEEVPNVLEENEMEEDLDTEPWEFEDEVSAEIDSDEIIDKEVEEVSPATPAQHTESTPRNQENLKNEQEIVSYINAEQQSDTILEEDLDTELWEFEDEVSAEIDSDEIIDKEVEEVSPATPAQHAESTPRNQENLKNEREIVSYINAEQQSDTIFEDLLAIDLSDLEIQSEANIVKPEVIATKKIKGGNGPDSSTQADLTLLDHETLSKIDSLGKGVEGTPVVESTLSRVDGKFAVEGVSCLVVALLTAAAFIHRNRRTSKSSNAVPYTDPLLRKKTISGLAVDAEPSFQNWTTEDVIGESLCPSEMSSFEKNSLAHSVKGVSNEAQSHDRNARKYLNRESLASSSEYSGSPSYGSFTTYERIPIKHVNGDDEIITPVRRSSRLRKQVTSQ